MVQPGNTSSLSWHRGDGGTSELGSDRLCGICLIVARGCAQSSQASGLTASLGLRNCPFPRLRTDNVLSQKQNFGSPFRVFV